jgi:hypothetical protein
VSLHNGIDTIAIATVGIYSSTYGSAAPGNIANLFASLGLFEDAPDAEPIEPGNFLLDTARWFLELFWK